MVTGNSKLAVYIMSGDYEESTRKLAQSLDIEHYFANTLVLQAPDHQLIRHGHGALASLCDGDKTIFHEHLLPFGGEHIVHKLLG